jgi:large subunit ribosomal protein L6
VSRVGKMPIPLPNGVSVAVDLGNAITVVGPKGQLKQQFPVDIKVEQLGNEMRVTRPSDADRHRAMHGLTRALLNNMVTGVSSGFVRILDIEGVGYRAGLFGKNLVVIVGYSHPVEVVPPEGIKFEVDKTGRQITISGIDKQLVGEMAAEIRGLRVPDPYKGKGVRYRGEKIRQKAGKTGKVGGKGGKK